MRLVRMAIVAILMGTCQIESMVRHLPNGERWTLTVGKWTCGPLSLTHQDMEQRVVAALRELHATQAGIIERAGALIHK